MRVAPHPLQQSMTPDRLQGRVNVVLRVAFLGAIPIGALAGGALGETIGLRPTLFVAAGGELLAGAFLLCSAVSAVREPPPVPGVTTQAGLGILARQPSPPAPLPPSGRGEQAA